MCIYVWRPDVGSFSIILYFLRQGFLLNLELANLTTLASHLDLGEPLVFPQSSDITGRLWGSELRFPSLHFKFFIYEAIFPAHSDYLGQKRGRKGQPGYVIRSHTWK